MENAINMEAKHIATNIKLHSKGAWMSKDSLPKQARYLKVKWQQLYLNPEPLSS